MVGEESPDGNVIGQGNRFPQGGGSIVGPSGKCQDPAAGDPPWLVLCHATDGQGVKLRERLAVFTRLCDDDRPADPGADAVGLADQQVVYRPQCR